MYPKGIVFGLGLYEICLTVGILVALFLGDRLGIRRKFSVRLQKLFIICIVVGIGVGFLGAVLFQAFYDFLKTGAFQINERTGMTFYGGLIFGAGAFLAFWFLGGKYFCKNDEAKGKFSDVADIAACVVPLAHGFGRLGCFFAGCCHGKTTTAWYGVLMQTEKGMQKVVPIQLFEALVLFTIASVLLWLFFKKEKGIPLLPLYCIGYGIWRFCIEYARGDDRGETLVSFLTPSQLVAVLLIAVGVVWLFWITHRTSVKTEEENNVEERKRYGKDGSDASI